MGRYVFGEEGMLLSVALSLGFSFKKLSSLLVKTSEKIKSLYN